MNERMKVSLCLITKNEQHCILSCINSVKHLVHEIVVVDTGSSDNTVPLAQKAGARVFHTEWTGDFAQARNFGLEQATGNWILILDADEVLSPEGTEGFYQLLNDSEVEGYFLTIKNFFGDGREFTTDKVLRLFRNKPSYRFTGAIHEQVAPSILKAAGGKGLASAPLVIYHYGYLDTELAGKDKFNRNTSIIYRELAKKPGDPFLLYSLALEHFQRGLVAEGVRCLDEALSQMRGSEGYFEDALVHMAVGLWGLGHMERLLEFLNNSLSMLPEQGDLLLIRGITFLNLKQYSEAAGDLVHALKTGGSKLFPEDKILSLALIVLLLQIHHLIIKSDPESQLFPLTGRLVALVQKLEFLPAKKPIHEYISVAAREIHAYALMIDNGYQGKYFCALDKMKDLVTRLLLLLMKECRPLWEVIPGHRQLFVRWKGDMDDKKGFGGESC
ncbi:glycosyltransferase [Desulforamulus putei]|uniref:Tetratricopeptide repeat-containing protein n=1 Tax=Desulforamulus putei DSM 12395 TaxID=1121429 RepID=A0A1M4S9G8_9FIRM|nr:glycosyltransferase family 2 protein [Desulforamulus putei]SHE28697.1 Tetratricopeptide repeat-containing protein [Desulforamulus putei DSM 12395]